MTDNGDRVSVYSLWDMTDTENGIFEVNYMKPPNESMLTLIYRAIVFHHNSKNTQSFYSIYFGLLIFPVIKSMDS